MGLVPDVHVKADHLNATLPSVAKTAHRQAGRQQSDAGVTDNLYVHPMFALPEATSSGCPTIALDSRGIGAHERPTGEAVESRTSQTAKVKKKGKVSGLTANVPAPHKAQSQAQRRPSPEANAAQGILPVQRRLQQKGDAHSAFSPSSTQPEAATSSCNSYLASPVSRTFCNKTEHSTWGNEY